MAPSSARHRARGSARTPIDDAARRLSQGGRRTLVAVGASGLVVTALGGAASADPATTSAPGVLDGRQLTAAARDAVTVAPAVAVPSQAAWTVETPSITVQANPKPVVVAAEAQPARAASRSSDVAVGRYVADGVAAPDTVAGNAVLEIAARYVGVPYVYGGGTPDGFDCSGFTSYVFAQLGVTLPRSSSAQGSVGTVVAATDARPGDLMWWPGHVAIYAGGSLQIDASQPGTTVQFRPIHRSNPTFIRVL